MQTALLGGASADRARAAAGAGALGASGLLVGWALFFGGAARDDPLVWLGALALLAASALAALAVAGLVARPALDRLQLAFVGFLAAFVAWCGASTAWSFDPDRSWGYTNRGLVYLAFAVLGLFVGALVPRAPRVVAGALAVALGGVLAWALLGKVFPSLFPDGARIARLRSPVGYWNGLALLGDVAIALALWIATRRRERAVRVAAVVLLFAALLAILLTYSRAGMVIAVVVVAAWLALDRARVEALAALAIAAPVAGWVAALALVLPGVTDNGQPHDVRVHDGALFGLVLLAALALVVGAARFALRYEAREPLSAERRRELLRRAAIVAGGLAAVLLVALVVRAGGPGPFIDARVREFTNVQLQPTQGPGRIQSFSSSNRWTWWKEAWRAWEDRPLHGTGAGSFGVAHRVLRREFSPPVTEPHNMPLQFLSETGLVGFALFVGAAAAAVLGVLRLLRRLEEPERAAALALSIGALAYGLHALVDFDWDFVALTAPTLFVLGVLLGYGAPAVRVRERRPLWALGAAGVFAAAVLSLVTPWLADRRLEAATRAIQRGDLNGTVEAADDAHSLNPLALEPLLVWAAAEAASQDIAEARRLYSKAVATQPMSPDAWYEYGRFELTVPDVLLAYRYLERSYELDRFGPATDGSLDRARRLVNEAASRRRSGRGGSP